jgi:hypothetical protein
MESHMESHMECASLNKIVLAEIQRRNMSYDDIKMDTYIDILEEVNITTSHILYHHFIDEFVSDHIDDFIDERY